MLDTVTASELRRARSPKTDRGFAAWAEQTRLEDCALSVITLLEMEIGCQLVERRDPKQGDVYRDWLESLREAMYGRVFDVDADVVQIAAGYHVPDPAPLADSLIAATAENLGLVVVTRNERDFARFGAKLLNPWHSSEG
ncbi:MAG: type II toxin-antitoxin system VapC family toxin [Propionibacteriaceae bacterium]|nr:type II toxin-antitoxin system VapC family toxin [Propionibacteriaceae bacterium]